LCCCDEIPNINNLREEEFILAHGSRHFSPSWQGGGGRAARILVARKEGERERGRERGKKGGREGKVGGREKERERERKKERDRERERQRENE
jgi:hypothetical protein